MRDLRIQALRVRLYVSNLNTKASWREAKSNYQRELHIQQTQSHPESLLPWIDILSIQQVITI